MATVMRRAPMATRRRLMPPARASAIHLPVLRPTPPLLLPPLPTPSALHGGGRGFHPLLAVPALAKLLLVKKVGIWGAYGATKVYGWPRVTRNLLKFNQAHTPAEARSIVQLAIVTAIRTPSRAYGLFQDTEVYDFICRVASQGRSQFPPWLMSIAESIAGKTHVWKALKELELETKKQKMAKMKAQAAADEVEKAALKSELAELRAAQAASEAKLAAMLEELSNVNRGDDPSTRA